MDYEEEKLDPELIPLDDWLHPTSRCPTCNAVIQDEVVVSGECMGEDCPYDNFGIDDDYGELRFDD